MPRFLLAAAALLLGSPVSAQGIHPGIAARVNGVEISNERFWYSYQEHLVENNINIANTRSSSGLTEKRREALELLVDQELLWQEAQRRGVIATPEEVEQALAQMRSRLKTAEAFSRRLRNEGYTEESYRTHLQKVLSARAYLEGVVAGAAQVSDEELEEFYRDNPIRFTFPEQVHVRHILLKLHDMSTVKEKQAAREKLQEILAQVRAGNDFAELAKQHSEDASASRGGDLGFIRRGQTVESFEASAFALQPGELSDVVQTQYGMHIIRVDDRQEARLLPLDEIREALRDYLSEQRVREAMQKEVVRLRETAEIQILAPL